MESSLPVSLSLDRWTAKLIARQPFDAVIAYENSALNTFKIAKKSGAACILDAASMHHTESAQHHQVGLPSAYKRRVDHRKDMEIGLADCIFTASELAAQSYRANACCTPVKAIALGVDIDRFKPSAKSDAPESGSKPFTFVFVGTATRVKGFDLLVEAVERLLEEGFQFRMVVAGDIDQSLLAGRKSVFQTISECGRIGHSELVSVLRDAHCLVLPSRLDPSSTVRFAK